MCAVKRGLTVPVYVNDIMYVLVAMGQLAKPYLKLNLFHPTNNAIGLSSEKLVWPFTLNPTTWSLYISFLGMAE